MSQWRRLALEKAPSCREIIESEKTPHMMWYHLGIELDDAYNQEPRNEEVIQQIYDLALWAWEQTELKNRQYRYLIYDVWTLLHSILSRARGNGPISIDLPNRLTAAQLERMLRTASYESTEADRIRKKYHEHPSWKFLK
jgi:hypothetical protein